MQQDRYIQYIQWTLNKIPSDINSMQRVKCLLSSLLMEFYEY